MDTRKVLILVTMSGGDNHPDGCRGYGDFDPQRLYLTKTHTHLGYEVGKEVFQGNVNTWYFTPDRKHASEILLSEWEKHGLEYLANTDELGFDSIRKLEVILA